MHYLVLIYLGEIIEAFVAEILSKFKKLIGDEDPFEAVIKEIKEKRMRQQLAHLQSKKASAEELFPHTTSTERQDKSDLDAEDINDDANMTEEMRVSMMNLKELMAPPVHEESSHLFGFHRSQSNLSTHRRISVNTKTPLAQLVKNSHLKVDHESESHSGTDTESIKSPQVIEEPDISKPLMLDLPTFRNQSFSSSNTLDPSDPSEAISDSNHSVKINLPYGSQTSINQLSLNSSYGKQSSISSMPFGRQSSMASIGLPSKQSSIMSTTSFMSGNMDNDMDQSHMPSLWSLSQHEIGKEAVSYASPPVDRILGSAHSKIPLTTLFHHHPPVNYLFLYTPSYPLLDPTVSSLFIFDIDSTFRLLSHDIVTHAGWTAVMLLATIMGCVTSIMNDGYMVVGSSSYSVFVF